MFNEIKFSEYVNTGKIIDKINLPDFLKVYLNHKPPFGNTMSGIRQTFEVLGFTNSKGQKAIRREDFLKLLQTKGNACTLPQDTQEHLLMPPAFPGAGRFGETSALVP